MMKVFTVLLLVLAASLHSASAAIVQAEALQLATVSATNTKTDSVDAYVIACDENVHNVNSITASTNLRASVFTIDFENLDSGSEDLTVQLFTPQGVAVTPTLKRNPFPSDVTDGNPTLFSDRFTCLPSGSGARCIVDYYCEEFVGGVYTVHVYQTSNLVNVNNYTFTFTEWTVTARDIGGGGALDVSLIENVAAAGNVAGSTFALSYPPPRSFRHYYKAFARTLPQRGLFSRLTVRVSDWTDNSGNALTTGTVALCISENYFVGANEDTSSLAGTEAQCSDYCENFNLASEIPELDITGCEFLFDELWLGVRTPSGGGLVTYNVTVFYHDETLYPVTTITQASTKLDGYLAESGMSSFCDPAVGEFSCENYYQMSLSSVGLNANTFNGRTGPWFIAHVHGVQNGAVDVVVSDDEFGGVDSRCSSSFEYVCESIGEDFECYIYIPPCEWETGYTENWVTTVIGNSLDSSQDRIFYGIDFDILSMPTTAITLAPTMGPFINKVRDGYYRHYSVAITREQITPASQLHVEMYSVHEDHDLALFWNFNSEAGWTSDCLDYKGRCETIGDATYSYFAYYGNPAEQGFWNNNNYCRFAFIVCDNPTQSLSDQPRRVNDTYGAFVTSSGFERQGLRVDSLVPGTYYFSVHALRAASDYDSYDYESGYTLALSYTGGIELGWDQPLLQHAWFNEYSHHFYVDVPTTEDEPTLNGVEIRVADVQNIGVSGEVTAHWNCDAVAGKCPCYANEEVASFTESGDRAHIFYIPRCTCAGRIWISVENVAFLGNWNLTAQMPAGFTVTASKVYSVLEGQVSNDLFDPENGFTTEFEVPRGTWGKASGTVSPLQTTEGCRSCLNYKFYRFTFNGLTAGDAFITRLEFTPVIENAKPEAWLFVISNFDRTAQLDPGCGLRNKYDGRIQACRARANERNFAAEEWSYCQLAFEPCTADASSDACYDTEQDFDNTIIQRRHFDQSRVWFAAVQSVDLESAIIYTLYAQVRPQQATALVDGVAVQGTIFEKTYQHYSFSVSGSSNAKSLIFEFYSILDQIGDITFYINFGSFAGLERDCLASQHRDLGLCEACRLFSERPYLEGEQSCRYQVKPCDLQDGTYYVSAYQDITPEFVDYRENVQFFSHAFFDDLFRFTISAHLEAPVELLLSQGHPITGHLWEYDVSGNQNVHSTGYYKITLPSNLPESRLTFTVGALVDKSSTSIFVTISQDDPASSCRCALTGFELDANARQLEWTRDACNLAANQVYYVVIDGNDRDSTEPITYTVHAELNAYVKTPLTLIPQRTTNVPVFNAPVSSYYISNATFQISPVPSPAGEFTLEWNQYRAFSFAVTATAGRSLNLRFWTEQDSTVQSFEYYFSFGAIVGRASSNGDGSTVIGSIPDSCDTIESGNGDYDFNGSNADFQYIHLDPCELQSGTYYLTFGGENLEVNSFVDSIQIEIFLVDASNILAVPTGSGTATAVTSSTAFTDLFTPVGIDTQLENNAGERWLSTVSAISLAAGDRLTFSFSGTGTFEVSFGDFPCANQICGLSSSDCTIFACDAISGVYYVHIVSEAATSFTITRDAAAHSASSLTSGTIAPIQTGQAEATFNALASTDEWRWHRVTHAGNNDLSDIVRQFETDVSTSNLWIATDSSRAVINPALFTTNPSGSWRAVYANAIRAGSSSTHCGAIPWSSPDDLDDVCCTDPVDVLFAVQGTTSAYDIGWYVQNLNRAGVATVGSSKTATLTVGLAASGAVSARRQVNYYSFTISTGSYGFYYYFATAETNNFDLYINVGERAGSQSSQSGCPGASVNQLDVDQDPSICHSEDSSLLNSCNINNDFCEGFVGICEGCLDIGADVYFAVTSDVVGPATFSLAVQQHIGTGSLTFGLTSNSASGVFPPSSVAAFEPDIGNTPSGCDIVVDHYNVNVGAFFDSFVSTNSEYFPDWTDPSGHQEFYFTLVMSNIRETTGSGAEVLTSSRVTNELLWTVNTNGGVAGPSSCSCYTGSETVSSSLCDRDFFIEDAASANQFNIVCEITAEKMFNTFGTCAGSPSVWGMAVSRQAFAGMTNYQASFAYTFQAGFFFNSTVSDDYNVVDVALSGASLNPGLEPTSFTTVNSKFDSVTGDLVEEVWFRVDASSLQPTDYARVWLRFNTAGLGITGAMGANIATDFTTFNFLPFVGYWTAGSLVEINLRTDIGDRVSYDGNSIRTDCDGNVGTEVNDNGEYVCSIQFAPRDLANFFNAVGRREFWLHFEWDSGFNANNAYAFGIYLERKPAVIETFAVAAGDDECFVRNLFDREWRFYRFDVAVNSGLFETFEVTISNVECVDQSFEAWSTFDSDSVVADVIRPNRLPTPAQHVSHTSDFRLDGNCNIDAGSYWVGVWAPEDFQLFPNPINIPDSTSFAIRSGVIEVCYSLSENEMKDLAPECTYSAEASEFVNRIRIPVEAENRGAAFNIHFWYTGSDATSDSWSFQASRNNYPWSSDCAFDTSSTTEPLSDKLDDFICTSSGDGCWLYIPPGQFESGYFYLYVDQAGDFSLGQTLHVRSYLERPNIHVAYLDPSYGTLSTGYSKTWTAMSVSPSPYLADSATGTWGWQYFKVYVDADNNREGHFDASLTIDSCDSGDCSLTMFVTRGPVGHANDEISLDYSFGTGNCPIAFDDSDGTFFAGQACQNVDFYGSGGNELSSTVRIIDSLCNAERDQYFIGVRQTTSSQCVYSLTVNVREVVQTIVPGELLCADVSCVNYYKVDLSGVDTRLVFAAYANLESVNGADLRIAISRERIPYFINNDDTDSLSFVSGTSNAICWEDSDGGTSSSSVSISNGCEGIDAIYIAVWNIDNSAFESGTCGQCSEEASFSLQVSFDDADASDVRIFTATAGQELNPDNLIFFENVGCTISCSGFAAETGTYISGTSASANSRSSTTVTDGSVVTISNYDGLTRYYQFNPSAPIDAFTVSLANLDSGCDYSRSDIIVELSTDPFCGTSCSSPFSDPCDGAALIELCEWRAPIYIAVSTCSNFSCPVSFDLAFDASFSDSRTSIGTRHDASNGWITVTKDRECDSFSDRYFVDVAAGQPLSVQIREPFGGDDVEIDLDLYTCEGSIDSCTIIDSEDHIGVESTCRVDSRSEGAYSMYGCIEPGRYFVDVSIDGSTMDPEYEYASYQVSAWNQWVPLSSVSGAIIRGKNRHFYSFANGGAAKIVLTITQGPSVSFRVTDDACDEGNFQYHQDCGFGKCLVDISTRALNSNAATFYVVLTSGAESSGYHANDNSLKDTVYSLAVQTGSNACGSRPNTGFCGAAATSVDPAFTSAAWDANSGSSSWKYENPTIRDDMARCKYLSMIDGLCPSPPDECKRWLRRLACGDAFPACDASGFLLGTCRDGCYEMECQCGKWLADHPRPEFGCLSGRYENDREGTCFSIPDRTPPPPPPPPVITVNIEDTCDVQIDTVDATLIGTLQARATACSSTEVETLLQLEAGALTIGEQFRVNEINGNQISVTFFGSNIETAHSICTRVVNYITIERDPALAGTCLEYAVAQIEENSNLLEFQSLVPVYVTPDSVINPPTDNTVPSVTVPGGNTVPGSGFTIPDLLSSSPASAVVPALSLLIVCIAALLF